ncbi:hypothetical protein BDB01DRAFT_860969 [Pilobolus umbonatus]|nr:hypothetical protein BDB01DRAFT_860969 [Pilobolus umbonatus]
MTTIIPINNNNSIKSIDNTLQTFIKSTTIADVLSSVKPTSRTLLDLSSDATIEQALDLLLAEDILSVPIYKKGTSSNKQYITIVSALDLLKLLSTKVSMSSLHNDRHLLLMPLSDAIELAEQLTILNSTDSVDKLVELFSYAHIHRVLIRQESNMTLLSQMDLVRFFHSYNHLVGSDILDLTTAHIVRKNDHLVSISYKSTAAEAFLKLAANKQITALPIIDDNDELVAEISAMDMRGLNRDRWDDLLKPVMMFLKTSHGDIYPPLTCHDQFTLSQIMTAFVLRKAYRLWWIDLFSGEMKGVVTMTDIFNVFASHI